MSACSKQPQGLWNGLSDHFGVALSPARHNVTGEDGVWPWTLPLPPFDGEAALEPLERRTAVDAILYRRLATRAHGDAGARRLADSAFAEQLVRYGGFTADANSSELPASAIEVR